MDVKSQDNFCRNLKAALEARGMSQSGFARRLRRTPAFVNQYLTGHRSPGLDVIDQMAEALDVPSIWLIDDEPIEQRLEVHA